MLSEALIVLGEYDTDEDISSGDGAATEDVPQVALSEEVSSDKTDGRFDVIFVLHRKFDLH